MKRKLAILLSLVMILLSTMATVPALAISSKTTAKITTSPVTLTWYLPFSWWYSKWDTDIAKYITQKTGVTIKFQLPSGDGNEKLNMMMAANDLPDIVSAEWWMPPATKLKEGKFVANLDDLMKKANVSSIVNNVGKVILNKWKYKGVHYSIPTYYFDIDKLKKGDYPGIGGQFVRKDIYEAIGRPDMSTEDKFIAACKLAQKKFPKVDGKPLIPVMAGELNAGGWVNIGDTLTQYFNAFFKFDSDMKAGFPTKQYANTKDMYKFLNSLVSNNLLMKDNLVEKTPQLQEKAANGRVFAFWDNMSGQIIASADKWAAANKTEYISIEPVRNKLKEDPRCQTSAAGGFGWFENFISKNCKKPEVAMKFLNYLTQADTQNIIKYGIPGREWNYVKGNVKLTAPTIKAFLSSDTKKLDKIGIGKHNMILDGSNFNRSVMPDIETPQYQQRAKMASKYVIDDRALINASIDPSSEEGIMNTKVTDLWAKAIAKLTLAQSNSDFDAAWNDYVSGAKAMGLSKVYQAQVKSTLELQKTLMGK